MRKWLHYIIFVFKTKGVIGLFFRFVMLLKRFDFSGRKMKMALLEIDLIGKKYNYKPAIIIPAKILKRYHRFFGSLSKENFEFAIHGYSHKNYKTMDLKKQVSQIQKAMEVFKEFKVPFYGFRAPYLSYNHYTIEAVKKNKLQWESDEAFLWDGFKHHMYTKRFHEKAIRFLYNPLPAEQNLLIPRLNSGVVNIPIGLPDDEMLVDRYNITENIIIESIWKEIFKNSYQKGYVFVLHLHPERMFVCGKAMDELLKEAKSLNPAVWITGMKEVTDWWKEKSKFTITLQTKSKRGYRVKCDCPDKATILGLNLHTDNSPDYFYHNYQLIKEREVFVESGQTKPCIGVNPQCDKALLQFLTEEGFPYELSSEESNYSIFLKEYVTFNHNDEIKLLKKIEHATSPIVRYWRWPNNNKSAFVTTHDLDSLTLQDFFLRPFE